MKELPIATTLCPKCNSTKAYYEERQTRSADEAATIFFTCVQCKHKWNENWPDQMSFNSKEYFTQQFKNHSNAVINVNYFFSKPWILHTHKSFFIHINKLWLYYKFILFFVRWVSKIPLQNKSLTLIMNDLLMLNSTQNPIKSTPSLR